MKYEQLPRVSAFGDYGVLGRATEMLLPTRSAGLSMKLPIFGVNRKDPERAESASAASPGRIKTHDTAQQVELEIRVAVTALKSAESQVAVAMEALTQPEKELAQAERRYRRGRYRRRGHRRPGARRQVSREQRGRSIQTEVRAHRSGRRGRQHRSDAAVRFPGEDERG